MFGTHEIPVYLEHKNLVLKVSYDKNTIAYFRQIGDETIEKHISVKRKKNLIINPVEPINTPESITPYLLIEFDHPVILEPQSNYTIYLTFPIEIGIFIQNEKKHKVIDVFALEPQKYTLYGEPTGGIICKFWHSRVHQSLPMVTPLVEGVLGLTINNASPEWEEINKAIFNAYGMKLFYDDELVFMKGKMKIKDERVAETGFEKAPFKDGMKNSIEIYSTTKFSIVSAGYVMEFGL